MTKRLAYIFILAACMFLAGACSDHDFDQPDGTTATKWSVSLADPSMLDDASHYNTLDVTIEGEKPQGQIRLSTDAEWLTIDSDTLPSDGSFDVLPEANLEGVSRTAQIVFTSAEDGTVCKLDVTQEKYDAENADPTSLYHIGYGYCVFDDYMNSKSFRSQVINIAKLQALDSDSSFITQQESVRGNVDYEYHFAYSVEEMQRKLVEASTSSTDLLAYNKTVQRFKEISKSSVNENYYALARMKRTVGISSIDVGALNYIFNNATLQKERRLPFTDAFYFFYNNILTQSQTTRSYYIRKMILQFGTHVIVSAKLGGSLELLTTYNRDSVMNVSETTENVFKYFLGSNTSTSTAKSVKSITSSFSNDASFDVVGGSEETRNALINDIKSLGTQDKSTLSNDKLMAWQASITYSDLLDADKRKNLGEVDFTFIPIWDLFADQTIRKEILSYVLELSENKTNLNLRALGLDDYAIPLKDYTQFSNSTNASLVRVLSRQDNGDPIVEICSEYVPKVRSDKRITVIYPIVNGTTRITQGIFPGDGENAPSYLSFAKGDVYVRPIDGYKSTDKLDTLYYMHGTMCDNNQGIRIPTSVKYVATDHSLHFSGSDECYPVVKIGSGYWTRSDIREYMAWGYYYRNRFRAEEWLGADYSFALITNTNAPTFLSANSTVYGLKGNSDGKRTHWYLPRLEDKDALTEFVGHNLKSLLNGQQSGFNANFLGRDATTNPATGTKYDTPQRVDKGQRCYIVFKDVTTNNNIDQVSQAAVLALKPDYTLETLTSDDISKYYYPVRLFRTTNYNYIYQGIQ